MAFVFLLSEQFPIDLFSADLGDGIKGNLFETDAFPVSNLYIILSYCQGALAELAISKQGVD